MKYFLYIFLFLTTLLRAQYTDADRQLAATTFTRNFDKVTCKEYLTSKDDKKVIAGLLSVSHSEDTSFVRLITALPIEKFAREICFALGQLGACNSSSRYLLKHFYGDHTDPLINYYSLTALGETGDSAIAQQLISNYKKANDKSRFNGISIALYYFYLNGKADAKDIRSILENEFRYSLSRQYEAAFSLYRVGPAPEEKDFIVDQLKRQLNLRSAKEVTTRPLPYLLGCLRKLQYFPDEYDLLVHLKTLTDFQSRVEAVRSSSYYNFKTTEVLSGYLRYLNDDNKNISREAATNLKNLKPEDGLKDSLKSMLNKILQGKNEMDKYTRGELLLSYLTLFPENFRDAYIKFFKKEKDKEYFYKACAIYPSSIEAYKFLIERYFKENTAERTSILESFSKFNHDGKEAADILFTALNSEEPALIATAADELDSSFISVNKDSLSHIILRQVSQNINNADFTESIISLETLSGKISTEFQKTIIDQIETSQLYSLKKFAVTAAGKSIHSISKDIGNFNELWENAFKYHEADITTEKGLFTISFLPGYAPVTVGNFCLLASKGFFNGQVFHRVVPGFVIQGGDPTGTGWGGPGYEIISEFSPLEYNKGIVGMASSGKDTEGSQWFITTGNYPHLNGRYTIFAEVLQGMEVIEKISQGDKILNIRLK